MEENKEAEGPIITLEKLKELVKYFKVKAKPKPVEQLVSGKVMYRPHLTPEEPFKYGRCDNEYTVAKDGSLHNVTKRQKRAEEGRTKKERIKFRRKKLEEEIELAQKTV